MGGQATHSGAFIRIRRWSCCACALLFDTGCGCWCGWRLNIARLLLVVVFAVREIDGGCLVIGFCRFSCLFDTGCGCGCGWRLIIAVREIDEQFLAFARQQRRPFICANRGVCAAAFWSLIEVSASVTSTSNQRRNPTYAEYLGMDMRSRRGLYEVVNICIELTSFARRTDASRSTTSLSYAVRLMRV